MATQDLSTGSRLLTFGAIVKDVGATAVGAGGFTIQFLDVVDAAEKVVIGALVIVIMVLRVRAHLKGKG